MHGIVHDWVVANTISYASDLPGGNGQESRVKDLLPGIPDIKIQPTFPRILEIGALDINGSMRTYDFVSKGPKWREMVGCIQYIGIDLIDGPSVDVIMNAHQLNYKENSFDLVLCLSMLEHDTDPVATIKEAYRVLKPGQPLILTTVNEDHGEHRHLGGGDTETYNFFKIEELLKMVKAAGFKDIAYRNPETEILIRAIK